MEEYIKKTLGEMVKTPSVSYEPMDQIVDLTVSMIHDLGIRYRVIPTDDGAPVIIASHGKGGVCFSGHLDTVPLGEGWKHEQGEVVGSRMYGRGTLDMKGPCVAMMAAAGELIDMEVPFSLVFTTDEEVSMNGAAAVVHEPEIKEAEAVVICEPTDMRVVNREKGVYQFRVTTRGKNAHASMPEKGDNAIVKMLPVVKKLNDLNSDKAGPEDISCCVDVICGGVAPNVIPDSCTAEIDVRFPHGFDKESIYQKIPGSIDEDFVYDLIQYLDPVKVDPDSMCIKTMQDISKGELWSVPYGTEMVRFVRTNPNTFIFGPGQVDMAHKPDEWIDLDELVRAADIYIRYAAKMIQD